MNVADAFYQTVHAAPGGCEALASRLGMSAAVLRNKANVNAAANKPLLDDADRIMGLTEDHRILHALARNHGYILVKSEDSVEASDMAVLEHITKIWSTNGTVGHLINEALADGRVDGKEVLEIRTAVYKAQRALLEAVERLSGMAQK